MISNQILQKTVDTLAEITRADFAVLDADGISLAATFADVEAYTGDVGGFARLTRRL